MNRCDSSNPMRRSLPTSKNKDSSGITNPLEIAIMGCIVNGPGEMADADFGYVGGAPGKIDLYVGKTVVKRGIAMEQATDAMELNE